MFPSGIVFRNQSEEFSALSDSSLVPNAIFVILAYLPTKFALGYFQDSRAQLPVELLEDWTRVAKLFYSSVGLEHLTHPNNHGVVCAVACILQDADQR